MTHDVYVTKLYRAASAALGEESDDASPEGGSHEWSPDHGGGSHTQEQPSSRSLRQESAPDEERRHPKASENADEHHLHGTSGHVVGPDGSPQLSFPEVGAANRRFGHVQQRHVVAVDAETTSGEGATAGRTDLEHARILSTGLHGCNLVRHA